jgi:hypothetical protein
VQVADRFTNEGVLYHVLFVRPNQEFMIVAEIEAVE